MNFERVVIFLSEFMDSLISNIIDMYVGLVEFFKILIFPNLAIVLILFFMGFLGLILFFALAHYFNKYLAYLTLRYEVETFGKLENPPVLKNDQKSKLKDILFWWDNQCDGWYTTRPKSVDVVLSGEQINLVDVIRIRDATQVSKQGYGAQFNINSDTQNVFNDLYDALKILEKNLSEEVCHKKVTDKLLKEDDVLSKQLKIAKYSALAAVASAFATSFLAYLTYLNMQN